jgi:hypothetical protein
MSRKSQRQPLSSTMPFVASMKDLHKRTDELFYTQAGLATKQNEAQTNNLRRAQEAYLAQYYETAGHIIALADGLKLVPVYAQTQRSRRHAGIYQAAYERPILGKNSRQVSPWVVGRDLNDLAARMEIKLSSELTKLSPEANWTDSSLDGYEQFKAAIALKEYAAEELVAEDRIFCGKVVPVLGLIALRESYDLLQAI